MGVEQQLPVCKATDLMIQPAQQAWLIEALWGDAAVGIIGGAPKCCKSWLGLDMAVSVASGTPCLGKFQVPVRGKVLIFLAEDAAHNVRSRIESICVHRNLDISDLDLYVITAATMRLDLETDQQMLTKTVDNLRPRLLILDPLVRLHRLDENSASDISRLLGFLRGLQRSFATAIVLVHHASKKHRAQPGQALRGSSDLHAFGDSNAYLARKKNNLVLTLEHRAAKPPDPVELQLLSNPDGSETHLEPTVCSINSGTTSLNERVVALLENNNKPLTRSALREQLKVNNQRLGSALADLEKQGVAIRSAKGWNSAGSQKEETAHIFKAIGAKQCRPKQQELPF
ncbi:MAG: AAA family ATPase [Bacteroidetes bacterium]|nr:AAA family ATPase [Bacteroidota bacterium]